MKPFVAIILGILFTAGLAMQKTSTSDWSGGAGKTPREIMTDYMAMTYDQGLGAQAADKYHAKDFIEHAASMPEAGNGAPLRHEVGMIISEGMNIAIRHKIAPGRGAAGGDVLDIYRIEKGRITDHWRATF